MGKPLESTGNENKSQKLHGGRKPYCEKLETRSRNVYILHMVCASKLWRLQSDYEKAFEYFNHVGLRQDDVIIDVTFGLESNQSDMRCELSGTLV